MDNINKNNSCNIELTLPACYCSGIKNNVSIDLNEEEIFTYKLFTDLFHKKMKMFVLGLSWTIDNAQQNYLHPYTGISILDITKDPKTMYTIKDIFFYTITKRETGEEKPEYIARYLGHKNEKDSKKEQYIKTFTRAVGGDVKCAFDLAEMYELKDDKSKAIQWYNIAAEEGLPEAQYKLANMYSEGNLVQRDRIIAAKWFKKFSKHKLGANENTLKKIKFAKTYVNAVSGYPISQYLLGLKYRDENNEEALYWLELSANQNFGMAFFELGDIFETGCFGEQNMERAIAYYFSASNKGNSRANYKLAKIYQNRLAANPENQENHIYFMHLLKKAAKSDILEAQYELATIYLAKKEDDEAAIWFKKLSEQKFCYDRNIPLTVRFAKRFVKAREGNAEEQCRLGIMYKHGMGIKRDDQEALHWFTLSADQDCMSAHYQLGSLFEEGRIEKKDISNALAHYQEAARLGHVRAQLKLAALSEKKQDFEKALIFYLTAATGGCAEAQYHVARLMLKENLYDQNEALRWLKSAVNKGYVPALSKLGELFVKGRIVKKDTKKGFDYLWAAAKKSDPQANFIIGNYYENRKNYKVAKKLYQLAAEKGHLSAQKKIRQKFQR